MNADQWTTFWACILAGGSVGFALLAMWVAVAGFRDVKAMFRRMDAEHEEAQGRASVGPEADR